MELNVAQNDKGLEAIAELEVGDPEYLGHLDSIRRDLAQCLFRLVGEQLELADFDCSVAGEYRRKIRMHVEIIDYNKVRNN